MVLTVSATAKNAAAAWLLAMVKTPPAGMVTLAGKLKKLETVRPPLLYAFKE